MEATKGVSAIEDLSINAIQHLIKWLYTRELSNDTDRFRRNDGDEDLLALYVFADKHSMTCRSFAKM